MKIRKFIIRINIYQQIINKKKKDNQDHKEENKENIVLLFINSLVRKKLEKLKVKDNINLIINHNILI